MSLVPKPANKMQLKGNITLPGDKSLSHRILMFAAMAQGESRITNLGLGQDIESTINVLTSLGVTIKRDANICIVRSEGFKSISGRNLLLDCGNSGTTLRLLCGLLAGSGVSCQLGGDDSLNRRPIMRVFEPLKLMGGELETVSGEDHPPLILRGRQLKGISCQSAIASAQLKSAVLLAALHADGETTYSEPEKSRDHTERFLIENGIDLTVSGTKINLRPGKDVSPFDMSIPGDISTALNHVVAALLIPGSEVVIRDVLLNKTRTAALTILEKMGGRITQENVREVHGEPRGDLIVRYSHLKSLDLAGFHASTFIDEVPILAIAAMHAEGETLFHNMSELKLKESDRLHGTEQMVTALGGRPGISGGTLAVTGETSGLRSTPQHCGDHRLAMAIEVANLIRDGQPDGGFSQVIAISAPEFYQTVQGLTK